MPVYEYEALLSSGRKERGVLDAESEAAVRKKLRAADKYLVTIRQTRKKGGIIESTMSNRFSLVERIKPSEINMITRQLATLLDAGIPLDNALASIIDQSVNPSVKKLIAHIKESVSEGEPLSQALGQYHRFFPTMYVHMVRAGEVSGRLDKVLNRLADSGEKQEEIKAKMKAALVYPIFMAIIGTAILFLLVAYVVPNIVQVFGEMDKMLPLPTTILIVISTFFNRYWWLLLLALVALFALFQTSIRSKRGKYVWDLIKLRLPVVGTIVRKVIITRFAATMKSLLESGVDIIDSLEIIKRIIDNDHITAVLDDAIEHINKGKNMASAFSGSPWFSPMFVQMVAVGEASGQLEAMLDRVASATERDVDAAILGMTSLIEPIMIISMGLIVGLIVLSILLPIFEMNQLVG